MEFLYKRMEIEDFKYEFDPGIIHVYFGLENCMVAAGYLFLHQFVPGKLMNLTNNQLLYEFYPRLEPGERIIEENGTFTLELNYISNEIIEHVKFLLKYLLILYTDFTVEKNIIKFRRIYDENIDYRITA